jgi:hypothetical protein
MAEVLGLETGFEVPALGFTSGYWTSTIVVFLILIILGVISFLLYNKTIYRIKVKYFENLSGNRFIESGTDTARVLRLGINNGEILYTKKKKLYLPADGQRMGLNTFYFAKNSRDGYWYNITLGDLDAKRGVLDVEPVDKNMKVVAYAIRKNTEGRLAKKGNLQTLLQIAVPILMLLILIVGGGYLINKTGEAAERVSTNTAENIKIQGQIAEANERVVAKLDLLLSESGLRPAP